jgi:hypothetical protein
MADLIAAYCALLGGKSAQMPSGDYCNGFWYDRPGLDWIST